MDIDKLRDHLIAVVGPTASGKSDFAINLAKQFAKLGVGADIINADSYARYKRMDIGTAKVSLAERLQLELDFGIRHFEIDVLEPIEYSTVAEFQTVALAHIEAIQAQARVPILCGGSGLYIRSVIDDFQFQTVNLELRQELEQRAKTEGSTALYGELKNLDAKTAATLQPENTRRIIRALEVIVSNSKIYQNSLPEYTYRHPKTIQFGIDIPREMLDERIDKRTSLMRELDLGAEVKELYSQGLLGETARKAIGYSEFIDLFQGKLNPANNKPLTEVATYERIAQHTKRLVRRQLSWFKRDPRINWIPAPVGIVL